MYLVAVVVGLVLWWCIQLWLRYRNFPPGPYGLPFLGYLLFLEQNVHIPLTKIGKKYGKIFSISFGTQPVVVLNDWDAINEALVKQSNIFSGRPTMFVTDQVFGRKDIAFKHGLVWKEQRRFAHYQLRNFGFGKKSYESMMILEIEKLVEELQSKTKDGGANICITSIFFIAVFNVIWRIVAGQNFDGDDQDIKRFSQVVREIVSGIGGSNILNFFPFLRFVVPGAFGFWKTKSSSQIAVQYLESEIKNHEKTLNENDVRDFIDAGLIENKLRATGNEETIPYTKEYLRGSLFNLFLGGVDTTDVTLCWGLLQMALHPEIQTKVHEEMDRVVGDGVAISVALRPSLPYTEATILEVQRYCTILPLSVPHLTIMNTKLCGYDIPKGTTIFPNLYAVHHSEEYWGDPHNFRPERFLGNDGQVIKHDHFIPFSVGARYCLGDSLAKMEVFIFFANLLHKFRFEVIPGEPKPSTEPILGAILRPQEFSLKVTQRA